MLSINEIAKFYPENMHTYKRQLLREYLQYKILEIIFNSKFSKRIVFMGGTAIRIVHNSQRFSEDIDFDSRDLSPDEFKELAGIIRTELTLEGFSVEMKIVSRGAFRCYIKFPKLLFDYNLSGYEEEKILIQLDAEKQPYSYTAKDYFLNKFSIFTRIFIVPQNILLSQKISAFLNRKRTKGRDIFDIIYLFSFTKPDYGYLKITNAISDKSSLQFTLLKKCKTINVKRLRKEIEIFLINPNNVKMIENFPDFVKTI